MRRYAAQYVFLAGGKIYKQYYIELDAAECIKGVYPFENEIGETLFFNGILFPVRKSLPWSVQEMVAHLNELKNHHPADSVFELLEKADFVAVDVAAPVALCCLEGIDLSASRFVPCNDRTAIHIRRLL
ncbi:MAG: hypothetical protein LBR67_06310 [Dysgonamonadaceae bacterium]|jgi:hypothetical protein|nr:hypothetical protein [Dysgonamonadaceae bacterium]